MWIDLRLERLQFGVSRKNAGLQHASLRGAGFLHRQNYVVRSDRQHVKHKPRTKQKRRVRRKFLIKSLKGVELRQKISKPPCRLPPNETDNGCRDDVGDK